MQTAEVMTAPPERENFPTFASVWDGSAHKIETARPATWEDSSQESLANDDTCSDKEGVNTSKTPRRPSLFAAGTAAKALWSVSSSNLGAPADDEKWKCEECNYLNSNSQHGECACCGTNISDMNDLSGVGRQIFVEEDEADEVSPMRTPPKKANSSLKELLARHPSFKKKQKDVESCSSATTTPTANLSPASLSPAHLSPASYSPEITKETITYTQDYGFDPTPKKEEKDVGFNSMGHPVPKTSSRRRELRACVSILVFMMIATLGIILGLWLSPSSVTDDASAPYGGKPSRTRDEDINTNGLWVQRGQVVFADEPDYASGASVALANDGRFMAIGVGNMGPVRAYHLRQEEWLQLGQDLSFSEGTKHVALAREHGHIMAIASETEGSVAAFHYDPETGLWELIGEEVTYGVTNRDDAKASVALSYDGSVLAVGVPSEGAARSDSVQVVGYDIDLESWLPIGEDILLDETARIQHGGYVALSGDGMVVAVASWSGGDSRSTYSSHAEVYRFFDNTWQQMGKGDKVGDRSSPIKTEASISLSEDGSIVAIGSGFRCRVFQYDQEQDDWSQIGQDLVGRTVSLSADGTVLAVGNPACDDYGSNAGETVIYTLDEYSEWTQVGEEIPGETEGDWFGTSLSLSEDGKRVAVGAPWSGDNADDSGSVAVFQLV